MEIKTSSLKREVKHIIDQDLYRVRKYPHGHFKNVFDIGSNIGIFSVFMRMLNPDANIYALEPCKQTFDKLKENTDFLNINCENMAFGNGGPLYFHPRDNDSLQTMFTDNDQASKYEPIDEHTVIEKESEDYGIYSVPSINLPALFEKLDINTSDNNILKFDCEGGEKYLLNCQKTIDIMKSTCHISFEVHFQSPKTPFDFWLKWEEYNDWIQDNFSKTHNIDYYKSRKKSGYGHYCITIKS